MNIVKNLATITFAIKLHRCVESCNTLNDVSNKVCVPNKTEDLTLIWVDFLGVHFEVEEG